MNNLHRSDSTGITSVDVGSSRAHAGRRHRRADPAAVLRRRINLAASAPVPPPPAEDLPLERGWAIWISNRQPAGGGRRVPNSRQSNSRQSSSHAPDPAGGFTAPKRVREFSTVASYWITMNSFPVPSKLIVDCNMWIFQGRTDPLWEHPDNVAGGRWTFSIDSSDPASADRAWLALHLALVGETLDAAYDVRGIALARRRNYIRMSVWTGDCTNDKAQLDLGHRIKQLVRTPKLEYQDHGQAFESYRHVI